ncbi:hypothetical protein QTG54_014981 [Skeletonema marinoi]|uniref:Uncharacterized protein n=1 Tax=Skeletonema marinoi TaxID=267567 RepID=A0AAD8XUN8_9STRA|nr:hypothetical protein QTG54_014981 [Skeletonema marinoi]
MTMIQPKKKFQSCLDSDYLNKWTLAIFTLILLMATSVALAVIFPYQGDDSYLRVADSAVVVDIGDGVKMSGVDGSNEKSNVLLEENDATAEQVSAPLHTNNVGASTKDGGNNNNGLFDTTATATDEQESQAQSTDRDNASCQMKLQQADTNLDNIIDSVEYITFLQSTNEGGDDTSNNDIALSTTQFEELPTEYQVNFDHLATTHAAAGTAAGNNVVVGIPISTKEEMQKVCLYISKKGSSAVGEFDWDQISSSP